MGRDVRPSGLRSALAWAACAAHCAGCADPTAPPPKGGADAAVLVDVALPARPSPPPGAGRTGDPCAAIVDLDVAGVREGDEVVYVGSNEAAAERSALSIEQCFPGLATFGAGFAVVLRYTPRPGRDVWATIRAVASPWSAQFLLDPLERCDVARTSPLRCVRYAPWVGTFAGPPGTRARPPVPGAAVRIVVRSVLPAQPGRVPAGRFELRLREVEPLAVGERCDTTFGTRACGRDLECDARDPGDPHCVRLGAGGARCREPGPPCDPGLECDVGVGRCRPRPFPPRVEGELCRDRGVATGCVGGFSCGQVGDLGYCVRDGSPGARCRATEPRCDGALRCSIGEVCAPVVPAAAPCDAARACEAGYACLDLLRDDGAFERASACLRAGELGAPCRATAPPCDEGLLCDGHVDRCVASIADGMPCQPFAVRRRCAPGSVCVGGACAPRSGRVGELCRVSTQGCDEGLVCDGVTCRPPAAPGGACTRGAAACDFGLTCRGDCARDGTEGARCRGAWPPCDRGLSCVEALVGGGGDRLCQRLARAGDACSDEFTGCASGLACTERRRCAPVGAEGTPCNNAVPFCLPGLVCALGQCQRAPQAGEACNDATPCTAGLTCNAGRCLRPGEEGASCRAAAPRCGPRLACDDATGRCVREASDGEACGGDPWYALCAAGTACRGDGTSRAPRCVADGAHAGRCRATGVPCDEGLTCHGTAGSDESWCG